MLGVTNVPSDPTQLMDYIDRPKIKAWDSRFRSKPDSLTEYFLEFSTTSSHDLRSSYSNMTRLVGVLRYIYQLASGSYHRGYTSIRLVGRSKRWHCLSYHVYAPFADEDDDDAMFLVILPCYYNELSSGVDVHVAQEACIERSIYGTENHYVHSLVKAQARQAGTCNPNADGEEAKTKENIGTETADNGRLHNSTTLLNVTRLGNIRCLYEHGSLSRMPSIDYCELPCLTAVTSSTSLVTSTVTQPKNCWLAEMVENIRTLRTRWIVIKINYVLCVLSFASVAVAVSLCRGGRDKLAFRLALMFCNGVWIVWRFQESVHQDTKWQEQYPYVCLFTNTVCYMVESLSLFMFALVSYTRFLAVSSPVTWFTSLSNRPLKYLTALFGFSVGLVCSVLHICLILSSTADDKSRQRCQLHHPKHFSVHFLLAIKIISLCFMYLLPLIGCLVPNVALVLHWREERRKSSMRNHRNTDKLEPDNILKKIMMLMLCAVFMLVCLFAPVVQVLLAGQKMMDEDVDATLPSHLILVDAVSWNLSTLAFALNTIMTGLYSS